MREEGKGGGSPGIPKSRVRKPTFMMYAPVYAVDADGSRAVFKEVSGINPPPRKFLT